MSTFGYAFHRTLESSLESIARAGYKLIEIAPVSPHLFVGGIDWFQRKRLRRLLADLGLSCVSINPAELNLISMNPELREVALRQYRQCIVLAHDLSAPIVNVIAGRQGVLLAVPEPQATELAVSQLSKLAKDANEYGVDIAVETVWFGFAQAAEQLETLVRRVGDKRVGVCVDVANIFGHEDVAAAVRTLGPMLKLAHLSDTWRNRFAHTQVGRGEVDFGAYLDALRDQNYSGPCIYELVDGADPDPRIVDDLTAMRRWDLIA